MTVYFILFFALYFVVLLALVFGWHKAFTQPQLSTDANHFISIIVAVRNEECNIDSLIKTLSGLEYPTHFFEIIFVNDHSSDGTVQLLQQATHSFKNNVLIQLNENEFGKKAALTKGIHAAKGEIIATTDADCRLPADWLSNINHVFAQDQCQMAIGLVTIQAQDVFSKLQSLEFVSVMGVTFGTLGWGKPIMCNGANLAFRKNVFNRVSGYAGNEHIASGDDEFLMRKIQFNYSNSIFALNAVVITNPQNTLNDFIQQRIRWASKWKANTSFLARAFAVFFFTFQLSWIALWFCSFFLSLSITLSLLFAKLLVDLYFLTTLVNRLKTKFNFLIFWMLQLLYPFYILTVGVLSLWKKVAWKDRKV